jgi:hypothetical protein
VSVTPSLKSSEMSKAARAGVMMTIRDRTNALAASEQKIADLNLKLRRTSVLNFNPPKLISFNVGF